MSDCLPESEFLFARAAERLLVSNRRSDFGPVLAQCPDRVGRGARSAVLQGNAEVRSPRRFAEWRQGRRFRSRLKLGDNTLDFSFVRGFERSRHLPVEVFAILTGQVGTGFRVTRRPVVVARDGSPIGPVLAACEEVEAEEPIPRAHIDGHEPAVPNEPQKNFVGAKHDQGVTEGPFIVVVADDAELPEMGTGDLVAKLFREGACRGRGLM